MRMSLQLDKANVLYVEDRLETSKAWAKTLKAAGLYPLPARTIDEANQIWSSHKGDIALVILDIDLSEGSPSGPEDGGLLIGEAIDRDIRQIPGLDRPDFLILTSYFDKTTYLHRAIRLGVSAYVSKDPSHAPDRERHEPYRIESYAQVLCARAQLRSRSVQAHFDRIALAGFYRTSAYRQLSDVLGTIFHQCFGKRPWILLTGDNSSTSVAAAGNGLETTLGQSFPLSFTQLTDQKEGSSAARFANLTSRGTEKCSWVKLLNGADGYQINVGVFSMPPSAVEPEPTPLFISELIERFLPEAVQSSFTSVSTSAAERWSFPNEHIATLGRMLDTLQQGHGLFAETSYSPAHTPQRIRRMYKGTLCTIRFVVSNSDSALVIVPEAYRPDLERLATQIGQNWSVPQTPPTVNLGSCVALPRVFVDKFLSNSDSYSFFDSIKNTVLTLDRHDFLRLLNPTFVDCAVREAPEQYYAKMESISPLSAARELGKQKRCFLGVSLENPNFDREELLDATLLWIEDHFSECTVVIGDTIHRLTRQIREASTSEPDGLKEALALGREFVSDKQHLFLSHAKCSFPILFMSDPKHQAQHRHYIDNLQRFVALNQAYHSEVSSFADMFVRRQLSVESRDSLPQRCLDLAFKYLVEEAAFCGWFADQGCHVLVYPGPIEPFKSVSDGKYPDAPEGLRKLNFVSLKLKRIALPAEKAQANSRGSAGA
jgi:tRNA-dependent cyclodipeptide synthase